MKTIIATIEEAQNTAPGTLSVSMYPTAESMSRSSLVYFYLSEKRGVQDLRFVGDLLSELEWLKGVIGFVQTIHKV